MNAIKPEFKDEKSFNPFDFWEGAPFKIKIRTENRQRNYDSSSFGDNSPLFDNDEAIEKVWRSQYPLLEFINPKNFKSYDEIKKKYLMVLNTRAKSSDDENENNDFPNENQQNKPPFKPQERVNTPSPKQIEEEDDDFKMFSKMLED